MKIKLRLSFTLFLGFFLIWMNILNLFIGARGFGTFFWLGWGILLLFVEHRHNKWKEDAVPPGDRLSESSDIGDPLVRMHRNARKMTDPKRRSNDKRVL